MDNLFNQVARRHRQGQRGFTLIELLVVIAVLAVLAAIVLFNVIGVANKGKSASCNTDKQTIQTAVDTYYSNTGKYPIDTVSNADTTSYADATTTATTPTQYVAFGEIIPSVVHNTPNSTTDGAFTYNDAVGTVAAANC